MKKTILTILSCASLWCAQAQNAYNLGADISMLPQYEKAGTAYYTNSGVKIPNVLTYLKNSQVQMNSMRVRLFVNPTATTDDPTLVQNLDYVTALGKRIKNAGLDFMLDFHYSDTWADPSHQSIPAQWKSAKTYDEMADLLYNYTKECLEHLKENGATPDFVQVGNEISYGMLWRDGVASDKLYNSNSNWGRFYQFLKAGAKAVREVTPDAKIVLHIERTKDANACRNFFTNIKNNSVDHDIIGLSYYPFWHGDLDALSNTLNTLATAFPDKPVQIVETAYFYSNFPTDKPDEYTNTTDKWAATQAGQKKFIEDLCTTLAAHNNVTGLYYWYPEENGSGSKDTPTQTAWLNRGLWDNTSHKAKTGLLSLKNFLAEKEAVGIEGIQADGTPKTADAPIYNLNGQRVRAMDAPGIYIRGGKKYLSK